MPSTPPIEQTRSWQMAWTLGITELISWGILYYAFSVLLVPMQDEFGWSAGAITGAYSLALLISGFLAPTVGRHIDRHGARGIMTAGSILGTLLLLAWSQVDSLVGFYLVWIGIGIALSGTLYDPAFAAIAPWFRENRGKAMLIITFFGGLASTVFFPLTGWLEVRYGWREALMILAGILAIGTILPHWFVIRAPHRSEFDRRFRPSSFARTVDLVSSTLARVLLTVVYLGRRHRSHDRLPDRSRCQPNHRCMDSRPDRRCPNRLTGAGHDFRAQGLHGGADGDDVCHANDRNLHACRLAFGADNHRRGPASRYRQGSADTAPTCDPAGALQRA